MAKISIEEISRKHARSWKWQFSFRNVFNPLCTFKKILQYIEFIYPYCWLIFSPFKITLDPFSLWFLLTGKNVNYSSNWSRVRKTISGFLAKTPRKLRIGTFLRNSKFRLSNKSNYEFQTLNAIIFFYFTGRCSCKARRLS